MTREEARVQLKAIRNDCYIISSNEDKQAFDMAIETLKAEPCEDAISRQAAIRIAEQGQVQGYEWQFKELIKLPSVNPQPKMGHWIMPVQDDGMSDPIYYQVRCSKCGCDLDSQTWHMELHQYGADKYCPNCGAKMVEQYESEV